MRKQAHKRSRFINPTVATIAALVLGGGGLAAITANASANWGSNGDDAQTKSTQSQSATVDCPDVSQNLPDVPQQSQDDVDSNLAQLDTQVADAYQRLKSQGAQDANSILSSLEGQRSQTIGRIVDAIDQNGQRPSGMQDMAPCQLQQDDSADQANDGQNNDGQANDSQNNDGQADDGQNNDGQNNDGQAEEGQGGQNDIGQGQAGNGPSADDFQDIQNVQPNVNEPQQQQDGSNGTFVTECGKNENGHFNPDNVIVAPGVANGAHHMHDYVGNEATDANSNDDVLANAGTTCTNGDQSTHYWPVLRLQNGQNENDANADGGGNDDNVGEIQQPATVTLTFKGSPVSKVTAMPRFLRIITGDAKAFTNGDKNANASWSCTGFEDRQLKDKYPICPEGSQVVRTFNFQSCWDGQNIDSADHRSHVAFAQDDGSCPDGFQAIPQLQQRITYDVPPGPGFAVDSFPEQLHKPITDHGDFINVMQEDLMKQAVDCINNGQNCK